MEVPTDVYHQNKCLVEGCKNLQAFFGIHRVTGKKRYDSICTEHKRWPRKFKKTICESDKCCWKRNYEKTLEVDHIDGNKANIQETNFITLCANCHKIKTFEEKNEISLGDHRQVDVIRDKHQGEKSQLKKVIRAVCMTEGCLNLQSKHDNRNGEWRYKKYCRNCMRLRKIGYVKKTKCENEKCGHKCEFQFHMLEVDHIDDDRNNNVSNNLQTLCANCHKIKTYRK